MSRAAHALGVELGALVRERPLSRTWRVRAPAPEEKDLALVAVVEQATTAQRELFATTAATIHKAGESLHGVLRVIAIAPSRDAFLTDMWTAGSARDLSALRWPSRRRVEFVLRTVRAIEGLHLIGMVHGCLCPANVLFDDALSPIVAEAGSVPVHAIVEQFGGDADLYVAFAAPEVVKGEPAQVRSDVYSLGRLLEDALKGDPPNADLEEIVDLLPADDPSLRTATSKPAPSLAPGSTRSVRPERPSGRVRKEESPSRARSGAPPPAWQLPRAPGIVGLLVAVAAIVTSALLGGANADLRGALAVCLVTGVALATTLVRPPARAGRGLGAALQLLLAVACATPVVVLDPLALMYRLAARQHLRGDAASRRAGIEEIVRLGRDFRGLFLAEADLSGLDLERADLRGADLSRANLTHTRLVGADVSDATLDETALAGADLRSVRLGLASVRAATCDDETRLPHGWLCSEGRLQRHAP